MKTFLLIIFILAGIAISTPEAQAKDCKHRDRDRDHYSYYGERPSCESRSYRTEYYPREYYRRDYDHRCGYDHDSARDSNGLPSSEDSP